MSFVHPWALAVGVAAISLPLVIHWLTRPRPRRMSLSTIRFVMEAVKQRRARHRLRDLMILLLRTAAVALLAWAFARPLIGARPLVSPGDAADAVRVVIVDQSLSMGAVWRGITPFERARTVASQYLAYEPGLHANLILAAARPRAAFEQVSANFGAMRDELAKALVRPEGLNVSQAINAAAHILTPINQSDTRPRELVVVSDFQRANWSAADFTALPKGTRIQFESVAAAQPPPNLAILRVGAQGRMEQGKEIRFEVDIGNYSPTPRDVEVELSIGEQEYRLAGFCPPHVKTTLSTEVPLRYEGWQGGEAKLLGAEDALAADNTRSFVIEVRPAPVYALITREPSRPLPTSSHFLERALAPAKSRTSPSAERVVRIDPSQLDHASLASASMIVLDHPGKLSLENLNLLATLVRRGRGLLYIAAEPVDATNLRQFAEVAGPDLKLPVEFSPPPTAQARRDLFLVEWRATEAPFKAFGESTAAAVGPLRFSGGLETRRLPDGLVDDILARYSDRSACLVITPCAAGAIAILNADLSQSNLPGSSMFVPLIAELTGRLLSQRRADDAACGEPLAAYLPPDAAPSNGLRIQGPDNATEHLGELSEESSIVIWRWAAAGPAGIYRVVRDNKPVFALATAAPAVESELSTLDSGVLTTRLAAGRTVYFRAQEVADEHKDDAWSWILAACAVCMIGELVMLKAFKT